MNVLQKFILMLGPGKISWVENYGLTWLKGDHKLNFSDFLFKEKKKKPLVFHYSFI